MNRSRRRWRFDAARQACVFEGRSLSYGQLNAAANRIARFLQRQGVVRGDRVGIRIPRCPEMLGAMLGVLKSGAAYVPLDPTWPEDRLSLMATDAGVKCVLTFEDAQAAMQSGESGDDLRLAGDAADLAYVIYTSGSTGAPKGVMVEHRNVVNFFAGMDERIGTEPGVWLAVTSISFDISVLELFWTLARGFTVVLHGDALRLKGRQPRLRCRWLPRRHPAMARTSASSTGTSRRARPTTTRTSTACCSKARGSPTPTASMPCGHRSDTSRLSAACSRILSVTSAALATITKNVQLRAGSCVVPLHSPIRIAEEWAVVDNLSNGRVGMSVAAGWAPPDFAIKPENFANAKQVMFESTEIVKRLWRGETVTFPGPKGEVKVRTLPRPVQKELPIWVTTAGNIDTYIQAGKAGANVLTHLLGQTVEEVAEKVVAYRKAWTEAGHPGRGIVTLMLHTLVGPDDAAVEAHRAPAAEGLPAKRRVPGEGGSLAVPDVQEAVGRAGQDAR